MVISLHLWQKFVRFVVTFVLSLISTYVRIFFTFVGSFTFDGLTRDTVTVWSHMCEEGRAHVLHHVMVAWVTHEWFLLPLRALCRALPVMCFKFNAMVNSAKLVYHS